MRRCAAWPVQFERSSGRLTRPARRRHRGTIWRSAMLSPRSEDLGGAFQRFVHAPAKRNADEGPEQGCPHIEPALADAERAMLNRGLLAGACRLEFGDFSLAHVPLRIDRLDQIVADQ